MCIYSLYMFLSLSLRTVLVWAAGSRMLVSIAPLSCITITVLAGVKASNWSFLLSVSAAHTYASSLDIALVSTSFQLYRHYKITITNKIFSAVYYWTFILGTVYLIAQLLTVFQYEVNITVYVCEQSFWYPIKTVLTLHFHSHQKICMVIMSYFTSNDIVVSGVYNSLCFPWL